MADNYLEKKMEEHRNGAPRYKAKLTPSGHKPGFAILPYSVKTALIETAETSNLVERIASAIRSTGCRVALSCINGEQCAQRLSCIYTAPSKDAQEKLLKIWGETELYISVSDDSVIVRVGRGESTIRKSDTCDVATFANRAANLCLYLSLPDSIGRVYGDFLI